MTVEIVTDFRKLMRLAGALGQAKKSGDTEAIAKAQAAHDQYKALCLKADRMSLGMTYGQLA